MDLDRLARTLTGRVAGSLRLDPATRELYAADAGLYRVRPVGALRAGHRDDLEIALGACRESGVPLTMRGAGTSLAGQTVGPGLIVDCSALDTIAIDPEARVARVGPGAVLADVNARAGTHGLIFGPDVATANRATLGGMISNNSAGARSLIYGQTADRVRALDVVLGSGSAAELRPGVAPPAELAACAPLAAAMPQRHLLRRVSGYALDAMSEPRAEWHRVLCGAEGTLGVILGAELELDVLPATRGLAVCRYPTRTAALRAVTDLLHTGPSAIELLDTAMLDGAGRRSEAGGEMCALLIEHSGDPAEVRARLRALDGAEVFLDPRDQERLWAARRAGIAWALKSAVSSDVAGEPLPIAFIEDPAVPPERLASFADAVARVLAEEGVRAIWYGHASVGCLHIRPVMDLRLGAEVSRMRRIAEAVAGLVSDHDGSLSGEHGDGRVRSELLPMMYPPETIAAFAEMKRALDPDGVLNPGVISGAGRIDEGLRARTGIGEEPATRLPFAGGVGRAARACNGNGLCRASGGAMCPTHQALGDERHATRGRAVLFRAAVEGHLPEGLADPGLHEALELCLGCKACARECPAEVDMAWMKVESLAARRAAGGITRSERFAAHAAVALSIAARLPRPLAAAGARLATRIAGRRVPTPRRWRPPSAAGSGRPLGLVADTFTRNLHPEIGDAALSVLASRAAVRVIDPGCCGRAALSAGDVERARRQATRMLDRLAPHALNGLPLVVLEPSCWSMLVDDVPRLLSDDPRAARVAERAVGFERAAIDLGFVLSESEGALVHPHCHQRALGESETVAALAPQGHDSGAGCCGMAGAFGYLHPEISRAVGEDRLAPAARESARVVASGTSCRQQITDLTGRRALHPAEALAASESVSR